MLEELMLILVIIIWMLIVLFIISACVLAKRADKNKGGDKRE